MTLPGIPVIYYGTEQGFTQSRAAMFAAGWASGGRDRFDTAAPLYRDIAAMSALRKANRVLSRGVPTVLHASAAGPGALAWRMLADRQQVLVVFNTAEHEVLLDNLATGLAPGTVLQGLYSLDGQPVDQTVGVGGLITLRLPPRSGQVWKPAPRRLPAASPCGKDPTRPVAGQDRSGRLRRDRWSTGRARAQAGGRWRSGPGGHGRARLARRLAGAAGYRRHGGRQRRAPRHRLGRGCAGRQGADLHGGEALAGGGGRGRPAGDDTGPTGRYTYPTDPSWGDNRQMDLRRVRVATAGGALRLDLGMARLTQSWNPANGFDHVAFTVFIQLPGREDGATVMPLQHAGLPEGMRWHLRLRVHGWSNALFSHEGASAAQEGTPVAPGAGIEVDARTDTVSLVLPASVLGRLPKLAGTRILVSTWDYDAGYRALAPNAASHAMGGGQPDEPRLMDMSPVIVVP
jgi:hypothetical protein